MINFLSLSLRVYWFWSDGDAAGVVELLEVGQLVGRLRAEQGGRNKQDFADDVGVGMLHGLRQFGARPHTYRQIEGKRQKGHVYHQREQRSRDGIDNAVLSLFENGEHHPRGKCEYGVDDDEDKRAGQRGVNEFGLGSSLLERKNLYQMLLQRLAENVGAYDTEQ